MRLRRPPFSLADSSPCRTACWRRLRFGLEPSRAASFAAAANRLVGAGVAPSTRVAAFWVPGRVEVMGKHTDYCAGRSLLCAVNRGFAVVSADRDDSQLRILATFELSGAIDEATLPLAAAATGEQALSDGGRCTRGDRASSRALVSLGVDLALSRVPEAGMSSSSAVIILTLLALRRATARSAPSVPRAAADGRTCATTWAASRMAELRPRPRRRGRRHVGAPRTTRYPRQPGELAQYSFCRRD